MAKCTTVAVGDSITEVNGKCMEDKRHNDVARVFRAIGLNEKATIVCIKPMVWSSINLDQGLERYLARTNSDQWSLDGKHFHKTYMRLVRFPPRLPLSGSPNDPINACDPVVNEAGPQGSTMLNTAAACGLGPAVRQLIAWGADVDRFSLEFEDSISKEDIRPSDKLRVTPLLTAAGHGHSAVARALVEAGAKVNLCAEGSGGRSPLLVASYHGHHEVVRLLLGNGAAVHHTVEDGRSAAYLAASNGNLSNPKVIGLLLQHGIDLNHKANDGSSALGAAVSCGHTGMAMMTALVHHGADVNLESGDDRRIGSTPLALAAQMGSLKVVKHLIDLGALVNKTVAGDGRTPLYMASQEGHAAVVQYLGDQGATQQGMSDSTTPLYAACWNGRSDVITLLLAADAEVNSCTGKSPLAAAARWRHIDGQGSEAKKCIRIMTALVDHGADVCSPELAMYKYSPLARAVEWSTVDFVKRLLLLGASPNMTEDVPNPYNPDNDQDLSSPILEASMHGNLDMVKYLAAFGAYFDDTAWDGAEEGGFLEVHEWLQHVAGWSAIEIAIVNRTPDVVDWLLRTSTADFAITKHKLLGLATSTTPPLCPHAPSPCAATTKMARIAVMAWSPERCRYYHSGVRNAMQCVMLVSHRLWHGTPTPTPTPPTHTHTPMATAIATATTPSAASQRRAASRFVSLPQLPLEIWIFIGSFIRREDFTPMAKDAVDMLGQRNRYHLPLTDATNDEQADGGLWYT